MSLHSDSSSAIYLLLVSMSKPLLSLHFFKASHLESLSIGGIQPEVKVLQKLYPSFLKIGGTATLQQMPPCLRVRKRRQPC